MNTWQSMTPAERDAALAEKLGWNTTDLAAPYGGIDVWWIDLARERGDQLICRVKDFDANTWPGMGLVVKEMAARRFYRTVNHAPDGELMACFSNDETDLFVFGHDHNEAAATAEAAWKALGGGVA